MALETIKCVDDSKHYDGMPEGEKVEIEFQYEIPDTLEECAALFTPQAILNIFKPALRLRAQKVSKTIRRKGEDVQEFMSSWKPSDSLPRSGGGGKRDLVGDFMKAWANMPDEKRNELLAQMNADKPAGGRGRK
jgi:hypothetical protein